MAEKNNWKHLSYSSLLLWARCSFNYYLAKVAKIEPFEGNEHTAFGRAIHDCCERMVKEEYDARRNFKVWVPDYRRESEAFLSSFRQELESFSEIDEGLIKEMEEQGPRIIPNIIPALKEAFGEDYKVFDAEHLLYEDVEGYETFYKGFIDLVIISKNGKKAVIDWKTCGSGWTPKMKSNKYKGYQLVLYKYFLAKKLNVDLEEFETYFALLKRKPKKNNVEIFKITSGPTKVKNALNLLERAIGAIEGGLYLKDKSVCRDKERFGGWCNYHDSEHCP